MEHLNFMFYALQIAITAYVFSGVLIQPDYIFEKYGNFLYKLTENKLEWLAYPLGYCAKCFSGQLALWYGIFWLDFGIVQSVFYISFSIFFTTLISKIY
tara:strand:+ start:19779 stop:20075 length:297 start_codon:yes stop_codon:yes gene_type:complete